jgi:hypothetical protein
MKIVSGEIIRTTLTDINGTAILLKPIKNGDKP